MSTLLYTDVEEELRGAVRQVLAGNGNDETEALVRRALQILTTR